MSEPTSPEPQAEGGTAAHPERSNPSRGFILILLVLLAGWFVVTQIVQRTGPTIEWRNDLAQAEREARAAGRRVFLLLYEPGCPVTAANDRDLFSRRFARERLARMVCCRVELQPRDPLRQRFHFRGEPLMLVLQPGVPTPLARLEGKVGRLQFETYVNPGPVDQSE